MIIGPDFKALIASFTSLAIAFQSSSVRRFAPGDYTLLHDDLIDDGGLDIVLDIGSSNGGDAVYCFEDETLKRDKRLGNVLRIVFRDAGVVSFVKYVTAKDEPFYQVEAKFNEVEE